MKTLFLSASVLASIAMMSCKNTNFVQEKMIYPPTKKVAQTDDYFGTGVADPYRWLENDTSAETAAWVISENKVTNDYLAKIPFRGQVHKMLEALWNFPKMEVPFNKGE